MTTSGAYEEEIVFKSIKNVKETNEFYLNEEMSEIEKINYILKKGVMIQKEAIINNLPVQIMKNYDSFIYTFNYLTEHVEEWDQNLYFLLAKLLNKTVGVLIENYDDQGKNNEKSKGKPSFKQIYLLLNQIIKFFIKTMINEEKTVSDEFIFNLNEIFEILSEKFRIDVDKEIVDMVVELGVFGKPVLLKRFCIFLSVGLIRISQYNQYNEELLKRFLILTGDTDLSIKMELSYQIRFLLKELEEILIKKKFYKILDNLLSDDDMIVKTEAIISVMTNLEKFISDPDTDFINEFIKIIHRLFEADYLISERFKCVKKVFDTLVKYLYDNTLVILNKEFHSLIKVYIKKFLLNYENSHGNGSGQMIIYSYNNIIENFNFVATVLRNCGENNFFIDVLTYLIKQSHEKEKNENSGYHYNDREHSPFNPQMLFYENLDKVK